MKTYLPKIDSLRISQGIWCVEAAWMDQIAEAYYLGGDFDGRNDCYYYYMVWHDQDFDVWNVGYNLHGQAEAPFSKLRCVTLARLPNLRDALAAAEAHAQTQLTAHRGADVSTPPTPPSLESPFYGIGSDPDPSVTPRVLS
jgi:hypothetical protein